VQVARLLRHVMASHWRTRLRFPARTLDAIEAAVRRAERTHAAEIRFAIETALAPLAVLNEVTPRAHAEEVFAALRVWDTEHNNGVLIHVQLADRSVEIIADRGLRDRVNPAEWEAVCRMMEAHYREGRFEAGSVAGVDAVGTLLSRHFPSAGGPSLKSQNQLPDRPTLL
jgi:uncharacterized membrane protein